LEESDESGGEEAAEAAQVKVDFGVGGEASGLSGAARQQDGSGVSSAENVLLLPTPEASASVTVEDLQVCGEGIQDGEAIAVMARVLGSGNRPRNVSLSGNAITSTGASAVLTLIYRSLPAVESLDLSDNQINNECDRDLQELLTTHSLRHLNLSTNDLTSLSDWHLPLSSSLETLILANNDLGSACALDLAAALSSPTCSLVRLDLSNTGIDAEGAGMIGEFLKDNTALRSLKLNDNNCGEGAPAIAEHATGLRVLSLRNTGLTDVVAKKLVSALAVSRGSMMERVDCSNNSLCTDVARASVKGLKLVKKSAEVIF